ncbi:aminopeptidase P N-terminal domain-containing protein [Longimicrobium terrae]|uniref:Xaa-Pro aminopeptidase n=1 Tax=Longimicrobium terrae TaxID=1639882 RepID=A0A841GUA7_9BACT|nr:Xaa-Pro aminopeptidase [Longimicrobium terrae]MBB6068918.1 Xaa-Pro aminopeptidase [Longimicrobium terrae]NNC28098.1 M24 family metallopeptidase [Longimicrobium terrae]
MTLPRLALAPLAAALMAGSAAAQQPAPAPRGSADSYALPATPAPAPISAREFAERRRALAATMGDGVLVALGEVESDAPFAQNSPFRWLTGVNEPGAALVISKRGGTVSERLYVPARNPAREVWDGPRLGAEGALRLTGIPSSTADSLDAQLQPLLSAATTLYTLAPVGSDGSRARFLRPDQQFIQQLRARYPNLTQVRDVSAAAFGLRATKSPAELDMIRRAVYITALAQREAMRATEPGMNEFEVHALIEGTFRRYGAERPGFGSIVGSGPNSTTLHYRAADRFMQAGEMLVMDIGASYNGYTADLTRSIPVNGRFTPEQREIYSIVLESQKAAEHEARPGAPLGAVLQAAVRVLGAGMARVGLIESADAMYDCDQGGRRTECPQGQLFFMHGIGYGIGLDVHDPEASYPNYGGGFRVGSAFTIEPGIYVRGDVLDYLPDTPRNRALRARLAPAIARYRNIGVRIEDDYFMGENGLERVSAGAPREIAEIEAQMALDSGWNRERRPEVVEWYRGIDPATP